jgi:hypothetical protein
MPVIVEKTANLKGDMGSIPLNKPSKPKYAGPKDGSVRQLSIHPFQ